MSVVDGGDGTGLGELVRQSCREVCETARLVRIDEDRVAAYAAMLATDELTLRTVDPPGSQTDVEQETAAVIAVNAINFGSGYHDVVHKVPGLSGARTMAHRFSRYLATNRVGAQGLSSITVDDCFRIFGQDPAVTEHVELMSSFASALNQLGQLVAERFDGSFVGLVEHAAGSAETLAASLLAMPLYLDRVVLDGRTVHFYKRAQITAADVARGLPHLPAARFTDLERLTAFADNLVPHVLRVDGLLTYDEDVLARIEDRLLLAPGSRAEVEIRAAGVEVVERLTTNLRERGHPVRAMDVDLWLWERGGGSRYKARPRHRTRCPFY